jgi:hypothetical protein
MNFVYGDEQSILCKVGPLHVIFFVQGLVIFQLYSCLPLNFLQLLLFLDEINAQNFIFH